MKEKEDHYAYVRRGERREIRLLNDEPRSIFVGFVQTSSPSWPARVQIASFIEALNIELRSYSFSSLETKQLWKKRTTRVGML